MKPTHSRYRLALVLGCLAVFAATTSVYSKGELPRKYKRFELGLAMYDLAPELAAFKCRDLSEAASECLLEGFPGRDEFMILKFYKNNLVAIAHYTKVSDFDARLEKATLKMGKPLSPEYRSKTVVAYTWRDQKTFITLTNLMAYGYAVYEVRDVESEPLFRRARPQ